MRYLFLLMADAGEPGGMGGMSGGGDTTPPDAPAPAADSGDDDSETGGTTPEEVASVLRGSGIKVTPTVAAPAAADGEDGDADDDEEAGDAPAAADKAADEPAPAADPTPPAPAPDKPAPVDAPAADAPDFTMEVEDAEGVTHKIASIEDLPEDFTPKNNRQIIEIVSKLSELDGQRTKYEEDQRSAAIESDKTERVQKMQDGWNTEIEALQADKRIPVTANPEDNERIKEVYTYMAQENDRRAADGRPAILSFEDALDKLENKEAREAKVEADKEAKNVARSNGAKVGGSSAPATSGPTVYRAGSARNITQALRATGLVK